MGCGASDGKWLGGGTLFRSVIPLMIVGSFASRYLDIPMRETPDVSLAELESMSKRPTSELPSSLAMSSAPIALPVILITGNTVIGIG